MEQSQLMLEIIRNKDSHYTTYNIPKKSGGFRIIENPSKVLKEIQRDILHQLLEHVEIDHAAHGFVKDRGIYTNAANHVGATCIVNLDLKDFFHTVTKEKVIKELGRFVRTPHAVAELVTYKDRLPMGAPTSPCISNICSVILDRKLDALAKEHKAIYTRYADDITFSSKTNNRLDKIIAKAHCFIKGEGYVLNYKKIEVFRKGSRMMVTGLVVNTKLNVPRHKVKQFRAEIDQTEFTGNTTEDYKLMAHLLGYNSFIFGANKEKGIGYKGKIFELIQ